MIRLGLQIPNFTYPGVSDDRLFEQVAAVAKAADESGFDSVFVMDHFYQLPMLGPPTYNMLEGYALLSAIAARTSRVQLGTLVTGVTYRNPAFLAKQITTLDVISSGRAICGIGAAWFEQEHRGYGFDFPPAGERLDRLEEAVQICRAMFTQERATFTGRHYRVEDAVNNPRPIRAGGIPIMIGGGGERRTLRLVAQYADACNIFGNADDIRHKLNVLEAHCEDVGRDVNEITKTRLGTLIVDETRDGAEARFAEMLGSRGVDPTNQDLRRQMAFVVGGPDEVAAEVKLLLEAGLDGLIFNMPDAHQPERVRLAGEVLAPLLS